MTDNRATQVSLEEFATTDPPAQVTQVTVEQWVTTATITGQALVTQVALEQWAPAIIELAGNLGGISHYGALKYGLKHYSRIDAFAPIFSADITVVAPLNLSGDLAPTIVLAADLDVHVNLIDLGGAIASQIALGGALSLDLPLSVLEGGLTPNVVLAASEFVSGPLWAASEPCPAPPWVESEPCPPSMWMPIGPCDPVEWKKSVLCNG